MNKSSSAFIIIIISLKEYIDYELIMPNYLRNIEFKN